MLILKLKKIKLAQQMWIGDLSTSDFERLKLVRQAIATQRWSTKDWPQRWLHFRCIVSVSVYVLFPESAPAAAESVEVYTEAPNHRA